MRCSGESKDLAVPDGEKFCHQCRQTKPLAEFPDYRVGKSTGKRRECRLCRLAYQRRWDARHRVVVVAEKPCRTCGRTLPREEFWKDRGKRDGLSGRCRVCHAADVRRWVAANPERVAATFARRRDECNRGQMVRYYADKPRWRVYWQRAKAKRWAKKAPRASGPLATGNCRGATLLPSRDSRDVQELLEQTIQGETHG